MPYANTTHSYSSPLLAFDVPFAFLKDAHLKAKVDIDGVGTFVADTGFTIAGDGNSVTFGDAATGGESWISGTTLVNLYRETPIADTDRIVDFQSGSVLTEADLDNSALQVLYAAQESADVAATVLTETAAGTEWDAESKRIVNVTDPVEETDAATRGYVNTITAVAGNLPDVAGGASDNKMLAVQGETWTIESGSEVRSTLGLGTAAQVNTGVASGDVALNSNLTAAGVALALPMAVFNWADGGVAEESTQSTSSRVLIAGSPAPVFHHNGSSYFALGTESGGNYLSITVTAGLYIVLTSVRVNNLHASETGVFVGALTDEATSTVHTVFNHGTNVLPNDVIHDHVLHVLNTASAAEICLLTTNTAPAGAGTLQRSKTGTIGVVGTIIRLGDNT